jgi:hypothetical protein
VIPASPPGNDEVVILTGTNAAEMLMLSACVADPEPVSIALTVKFALAAVVGVPVI